MARNKLRGFRAGKGMTQEKFSKAIGFTRTYYGGVERGVHEGSMKFWKAISEKFGVPMKEVVELMQNEE